MSRRIEVELTSRRDDGTWTWRAAGAKEPKGVVEAALLHEGARTGDVVRVVANVELDGISVTSVLPPKDKKPTSSGRLEVLGPPPPSRATPGAAGASARVRGLDASGPRRS